MKFEIDKKVLDNTLEVVSKFSDPINSIYGLRCILIKVDSDFIEFQATNGSINIIKKLVVDNNKVKVFEKGKFLIHSNIFKNVIKKLSKSILIEKGINDNINIYQGESEYSIATNKIESFPIIEESTNVKYIEIDTNEFKKAIKSVQFAVSNDNNLLYKCINFKFKNNEIRLAASDTYRLAYYQLKVNNIVNDEFDLSILSNNVKDLLPFDVPKKVKLFYNNLKFGINYNNTIITSRIIDQPYKNMEEILNKLTDLEYKITINKDELMDILNKGFVIASTQGGKKIEININSNEFKVSNYQAEIGNSVSKTHNFKLEGRNSLSFEVNFNFIKDAISVFDGEIYLLIDKEIRKILIISKSNENCKQLITPIK
ncbi:DNA polymerase III subunit beta [Mycoplasmopsis gallinarum]|uniref:DNA polymerase III beta subunit n=1 Tax=Mycoplasmopsis gallinarum TaxID=29557 RepID=A0A168RAG0_9BACT|nr:DNA polymerase III subunit beta [Mycoplasmopsis gallinarum]OAB48779.1 DNA polymerase III beta subunit [Mycoplasmopsis gallinarum]